jgi:hypothetical protein
MNHQTLTLLQKKWLGWIIANQWDWLNIHINAPANHQKLNWTYTTGLYDISTKGLLNFILNRFNEDEGIKREWYLKHEWDKANVI